MSKITMLKFQKNIVLIGMMGSGKSMVAKALARKLKMPRLSTDELIEKKAKLRIKDLVAQKGWEYFRALEHKIVVQVSGKKGIIIDCGGGVVMDPENLSALKANGIVFFLNARPAVIYQRVKNDPSRPLVDVPNPLAQIRRIYKQRLPLYNQAHYAIDASGVSIEGPVAQILARVIQS
ncbi:MAG: shikimate kinase [Candidatus Omnitrophica bacterium]|nr:shikimate kinase [Candidatus Omnitrophota bacterium]